MDKRATFLIPDSGLDSRSYPLEVEVLDGMPSSVWTRFQRVVDDVGPDDGRFEDQPLAKCQLSRAPRMLVSMLVISFLRSENIIESSVSRRY
jgi:hypothetical protein